MFSICIQTIVITTCIINYYILILAICTLCRKTLASHASGAIVPIQNEKKDDRITDLVQEEQFNGDDTSDLVNEICAPEQRTEELESITVSVLY